MLAHRYTSNHRHYWSEVIEALNLVHLYIDISEGNCDAAEYTELILEAAGSHYQRPEDYVRYVLFVDAIGRCRYVYRNYCSPRFADFGLRDEHDADQFFHEMLLHRSRLIAYDATALTSYNYGAKAVPLRLLDEAA